MANNRIDTLISTDPDENNQTFVAVTGTDLTDPLGEPKRGMDVETIKLNETIVNDIDGDKSIQIVRGKDLESVFEFINSVGIMEGKEFNSFLCESQIIDNFKTIHFFENGSEVFQVPIGPNADNDIGVIELGPGATPRKLVFIQALVLGNEALGSNLGAFASIGGTNATFTILQALDDNDVSVLSKFSLKNNNILTNDALVPEGIYQLVIRVNTDGNDPSVKTVTLIVLATALISDINLSNVTIEVGSPTGSSVGALTTDGGESPITFTILVQKLGANADANDPDVDIFELSGSTLQTKADVGSVGTFYNLIIQAEDSRSFLSDADRLETQSFNIEVVADAFIDTNSYTFDGVDEYIFINDSPSLAFGAEFTFSVWVKPTNTGVVQYIASQFREAGKRSWAVRINSSGAVAIIYSQTGTATDTTTSPTNLTFGVWSYVTVTFSGNDLRARIYYDGVLQLEEATLLTSLKDTDVPFLLGALGDQSVVASNFYSGFMNELSVYNKEITASQAVEIFSLGTPTNLIALSSGGDIVSWYRCADNLSGLTEPDEITANANDGTLTNMNISNRSTDVP